MRTFHGSILFFSAAAIGSLGIIQEPAASYGQVTSDGRQTFEVATIKPSGSATYVPGPPARSADYFAWNGKTLKMLVNMAYFVRAWQVDWQVKGGTPGWLDSRFWDVEGSAKSEDVNADQVLKYYPRKGSEALGRIPRDKLAQEVRFWLMVQTLLEERFKLHLERQTRQAPVYNLVVVKRGPKITADDDQSSPPRLESGTSPAWVPPPGGILSRSLPSSVIQLIEGRSVWMELIVQTLQSHSDRLIIDRTNLKGRSTFRLQWSEEVSGQGDSPLARRGPAFGPAFFTAVQEQLGLRLESAKGPVEFLVITSVQKPEGIN